MFSVQQIWRGRKISSYGQRPRSPPRDYGSGRNAKESKGTPEIVLLI